MSAQGDSYSSGRAAIVTSKRDILSAKKKAADHERDICSYSQKNLEAEHHNLDLAEKRLNLEDSLASDGVLLKQKQAEVDHLTNELKGAVSMMGKATRIELDALQLNMKQARTNRTHLAERVPRRESFCSSWNEA